jgi:glycosyltransferase involved in cell wall biosynthesis
MSKKQTKILYIITKSVPFGGAQQYVYDLAVHCTQKPKEYDVTVALGGSTDKSPTKGTGQSTGLSEKLTEQGVRVARIPSLQRDMSLIKDVCAFFEIVALLARERPTLVHLNSSKAGGLGALAVCVHNTIARITKRHPRAVSIFTSHGLAFEDARFRTRLALFATWLTFSFSHTVILISKDNFIRAQKMPFTRHKLNLIYNGIAPVNFLPQQQARAVLLSHTKNVLKGTLHPLTRRRAPATTHFFIGTIGEINPNKGLVDTLHALALVRARGYDFLFVHIGTGEDAEKKRREDLVKKLGLTECVAFAGFIENARTLLRAFDIFTFCSHKEGHPYTLLEVAQARLPLIATDIPGIRDIVENDTSGLLVPAQNPEEIAHALERLIIDKQKDATLCSSIGNELQSTTAERFSQKKMLVQTEGVYNTIPK